VVEEDLELPSPLSRLAVDADDPPVAASIHR
jgi:hypothetical protein